MGTISKNLGIRIKELRERNKITQLKLAELINMESSNLSKLERGMQMPKEESLESIANVLHVEVKELFDFSHIKQKNDLLKSLINILNNSTENELQMYYKVITSIKEFKK